MTATIRDLLHQIHQTHDLGVLPVLADALLDVGYPETEAAWVRGYHVEARWFLGWKYFAGMNQDGNEVTPLRIESAMAAKELAAFTHNRLTVPCGVCEGRTPQFCSGPCGGVGWLVKPPFQRRKCPECDGDGTCTVEEPI